MDRHDTASGALAERPALDDGLARPGLGDVLDVWRLDRSLRHQLCERTTAALGQPIRMIPLVMDSAQAMPGAPGSQRYRCAALQEHRRPS